MIRSIDHIVIVVDELERAIADYGALGFSVVRGGEHADGATHNALVVFADDTYLELIAFRRPAADHRWWQASQRGEGLVDYALLPGDIAQDIADARGRGLALEGPLDGGRLRPDGQRLAWQTATPPTADLPFLCGDITPRALRVPEGAIRQHPNGARGIAAVIVAAADLAASARRYHALLGTAAAEQGGRATFRLGAAELVLAAPGSGQDADLRDRLAARGEGPHGVLLRGGPGAPHGPLDPALAHGARIELVAAP